MRGRYLLRRVAHLVLMILVVILIDFLIIHLAPGDPASAMAGENASPQYVEQLRVQFGLDKPIFVQFWLYIENLAQGNLGYSFASQGSVLALILSRLPATLLLLGVSQIPAFVIGVLLGALSARYRGRVLDKVLSILTLTLYSVPVFWSGMVLILIFSIKLGWLPSSGMSTYGSTYTGWANVADVAKHLVLPGLCLMLYSLPTYVRLTRASMMEVLNEDYIRTVECVGFTKSRVIYRYALRNALLPAVTHAGLSVGFMFAGALLTETVFAWPGMGSLMYNAVFQRDYPTVMGIFLMTAICIAIMSIITDIVYSVLDPRVKYD